jgi:hypothetical protein
MKEELENNHHALTLLASETSEKLVDYKAQVSVIEQQLEDLGKPEVTPMFLDRLSETITEAVENIDLEDGITCDFELDYDNKVTMSGAQFENSHEVADKIYYEVAKLFAEAECPELDTTEDDNHPVEKLQG